MAYQLNTDLTSKVFYIDSRDATSYLSTKIEGGISENLTSHFLYTLKEPIIVPPQNYALVYLHGATIPYSFYAIRKNINDKFTYRFGRADGTNETEDTITITEGNYDVFSFIEQITNGLKGAAAGAIADGFTGTYPDDFWNITYNNNTQKYNFRFATAYSNYMRNNLGNHGQRITFDVNNTNKFTAQEFFGFDEKLTADPFFNTDQTATALLGLNSADVVDMTGGIHGVFIRTNLTSVSTFDSATGNISNILARIPIKVNRGGIIFAEPKNTSVHKALIQTRQISSFLIRITDERNKIIDLNGLNLQLSIGIDFVKYIPPTLDVKKEDRRDGNLMYSQMTLGDFARRGRVGKAVLTPTVDGVEVERRNVLREQREQQLGILPEPQNNSKTKKNNNENEEK